MVAARLLMVAAECCPVLMVADGCCRVLSSAEGGFQAFKSWEIPIFLLMGLIGGLLGALFNALNIRLSLWRKKHRQTKAAMVMEAVAVGLLTATCQFWLPAIIDHCYPRPSDAECAGTSDNCLYVRYTCDKDHFSPMATAVFTSAEDSIKGFFHNTTHYHPQVPNLSHRCLAVLLSCCPAALLPCCCPATLLLLLLLLSCCLLAANM